MRDSIKNLLIWDYAIFAVKNKTIRSLLSDLELVKAVQPNFLMVFAKKLPLNPQPKIKNLCLFNGELAFSIMRYYSSTYVLIDDEVCS